jgi:hypothetical protein
MSPNVKSKRQKLDALANSLITNPGTAGTFIRVAPSRKTPEQELQEAKALWEAKNK